MDTRIIFFDLDGTLLDDTHRAFTPRTLKALAEARARGIRLVACTGRVRCMLPPCVYSAPLDFLCCSSGADTSDLKTGERLFHVPFTPQAARAAWEILRPCGLFLEWFAGGEAYLPARDLARQEDIKMPFWHHEYYRLPGAPVMDEDMDAWLQGPGAALEKINHPVSVWEGGSTLDVQSRLAATGLITVCTSTGANFEATDKRVCKGDTLLRLCRLLDIPQSASMAFGDGGNDIDLLEAAGWGVAMGSAPACVREAAQDVALSNTQDGVARYLEAHVFK